MRERVRPTGRADDADTEAERATPDVDPSEAMPELPGNALHLVVRRVAARYMRRTEGEGLVPVDEEEEDEQREGDRL